MVDQGARVNQMTIGDQIPPEHDHPLSATGFPIGARLPTIHAKLVTRIEGGEFIKISNLLCDHLGTLRNEDQKLPNAKQRTVTNILEWIKCFCIYMPDNTSSHTNNSFTTVSSSLARSTTTQSINSYLY